MRRTSTLRLVVAGGLLAGAATLSAAGDPPAGTDTDPIVIVMQNKRFKDKEDGEDTANKAVEVKVGQTVVWKNLDDMKHTASSVKTGPDGKRLFDLKVGEKMTSEKLVFTEDLYKAFGGTAGGKVDVNYVCKPHQSEGMKGKIVLRPKE